MHAKLNAQTLTTALTALKPFVDKKAYGLPVLSYVHCRAVEGGVILSTTDLKAALSLFVPSEDAEGDICIDLAALHVLAKGLSKHTLLTLTHTPPSDPKGEWTLQATAPGVAMTMPAIDADEYPVLPTEFSGSDLVLDAEGFRSALAQTLPCVGVDSTRGVLTNLRCAVKDGQLTLVATDAYRLAIATLPVEAPDQVFLLPACNAARLERVLPKSGPVTLTFSPTGGQVRVSFTGYVCIAQLSSEQFVNYQQIIPKAPPVRFAVSAEVLARCLALVGKEEGYVRLGGGTESPDLLVSSPDRSANAAAPAMWGEPLVIGINRQFLLDLCKVAGKGKLTMATHGPTMAMLWTVDTLPAYQQVIMPHGLGN